jgi:hypothetical protein
MPPAWWDHLGEALEEAAAYLTGQEPTTADYLSRAAWMVRAIAEEEAAGELRCRYSGSGARRGGQSRRWSCWRSLW